MYGELLATARRARQHQIGEVGAGDEQHRANRRKQCQERGSKLAGDAIDEPDQANSALSRILDRKLLLQTAGDPSQFI